MKVFFQRGGGAEAPVSGTRFLTPAVASAGASALVVRLLAALSLSYKTALLVSPEAGEGAGDGQGGRGQAERSSAAGRHLHQEAPTESFTRFAFIPTEI